MSLIDDKRRRQLDHIAIISGDTENESRVARLTPRQAHYELFGYALFVGILSGVLSVASSNLAFADALTASGLVSAVGELISVIGPILAAVPAIALAATVSPQTALITALYCWAQQFVENNFLVPRIMERQVGVSPVTIIVALLFAACEGERKAEIAPTLFESGSTSRIRTSSTNSPAVCTGETSWFTIGGTSLERRVTKMARPGDPGRAVDWTLGSSVLD